MKTNFFAEYVDYVDRSLREHVNFVDTTAKQLPYFKKVLDLFVIIFSLFLFHLLFKNLND